MIEVFRERGIKVHIIGPAAALGFGMDCVMKAARNQQDFTACGITAEQARAQLGSINGIFARAAAVDPGVTWTMPTEFMCKEGNCSPLIGDVFVYRSDGFHLNYDGAKLLSKFIHLPNAD